MSLTTSAISRILNGEDVSKAVVQVLDYDGEAESVYRILISDGEICSHVLLNVKHNSLITNKKLEIFTIIQVNKCVWDYDDDEAFITLLDLTVLTQASLIGRTLGNPIYTSAKSRDASEETATEPNSTAISQSARVSSKASNSMKSLLTESAVTRIMNGDDVPKAIVQVLGYEGDDEFGYEILISDGVISSYVFINKKLNSLITNEELGIFAIIQVNKFVSVHENNETLIILKDISVFIQASLVGGTLGNPAPASEKSRYATKRTAIDPNNNAISPIAGVTGKASNSMKSLLTAGAVSQIVNGEDVSKAIVQVLDYEGDDESRYEIVISDGDVSSHVFLNKQLNSLITNKELEDGTIIQINKCVWDNDDETFMTLQDITIFVQASLVGGPLGNPIYISGKSRDATKERATDSKSTAICQISRVSSKANSDLAELLAPGTINQILNGKDVSGAVLQVIGYVKGIPRESYSVLISDGDFCAYALLQTELSSLITNEELKTFSIIGVHKYVCINNKNSKLIILLNISVIVPAAVVGKVLGHPVNALKISRDATEREAFQSKSTATSQMITSQKSEQNSATKLTPGSVSRILNENYVTGVVTQVLNYEKVCGPEEYYLINISDGCFSSNVYLDVQLNKLITNRELDMLSIMRVDESVTIAKGQSTVKAIVNLTILTPGAEVGKILGNPVSLSVSAKDAATGRGTETRKTENSKTVTNIDPKLSMFPKLTEGSIARILNGKTIDEDVVMQVLGYIKVTLDDDIENHSYRLHISDGAHFYSFAVLHKKLHSHIINHHLERFTLISVDDWVCQPHTTGCEIMIVAELTILIPGADVGIKVGNPVNYASIPVAHGRVIPNTHQPSMLPKLTAGSIKWILNGDKVHASVMQVLGYNKCSFHEDSGNERYMLLISDGVYYRYVLLHTRLNRVVFNRGLEDFTIIRVLKYHCKQEVPGRKIIIIITDLAILMPGADVGKKLGHPVNYSMSAASVTGIGISDTH